jgi:hypothetical protein
MRIDGMVAVPDSAREWRVMPAQPWRPGSYRLRVSTDLPEVNHPIEVMAVDSDRADAERGCDCNPRERRYRVLARARVVCVKVLSRCGGLSQLTNHLTKPIVHRSSRRDSRALPNYAPIHSCIAAL